MAAGDVVNGFLSHPSNFQPAAGVEVVITSFMLNSAGNAQITLKGLTDAQNYIGGTEGDGIGGSLMNIKFFINNTNYLRNQTGHGPAGYTGIQIK